MATQSPKGCLPHGWIVKTSKQYPDRVYYFNIFTGASTWECPVLDPPRLTDEKETPSKSEPDVPCNSFTEQEAMKYSSPPAKMTPSAVESPPTAGAKADLLCPPQNKRKRNSRKRKSADLSSPLGSSEDSLTPPTAVVAPVCIDKSSSTPSTSTSNNQCVRVVYNEGKKQTVDISISSKPTVLKGTKSSPRKKFKKPSLTVSVSEGVDKIVTVSKDSMNRPGSSYNDLEMEDFSASRLTANESFSSSSDDIEMLDVSADLTKIDDIAVPLQAAKDLCSYYIVIDTNVLIEDLKKISRMKDTPLGNCGPPHIFIPWIVIQELDSLKKSYKTSCSGRAAQQAVRYLNEVLKSKHPRFHGQSPQEAQDCAKSYSLCNDDKILECCMSLAQKMPAEKVVLITYDKNLINKALICGINAHTWDSLLEAVEPKSYFNVGAVGTKSEPIFQKKKKNRKNGLLNHNVQPESLPNTPQPAAPETAYNVVNVDEPPKCPDGYETDIFEIMCEARQLLKDVLEPFLAKEMDDAYGNAWNALKIDKHLLSGILNAISRYWKQVFSKNFSEKDRRNFDLLKEKVHCPEGLFGDREDCLNTLTAIEDIFCHIKRRWPQLMVPINQVENLRANCNNTFSKLSSLDVSVLPERSSSSEPESSLSESETVVQAFDNAWTVVNHLCGMVMDFYHIPHNFKYELPDSVPSDTEFREMMVIFYPCVLNIKKLMLGVVSAIKNHNPRRGIFKELYTALVELVPTLNIQFQHQPSMPGFCAEALERYCRDPTNTERIQNGCKEMERYIAKLDEAVKVMSSPSVQPGPNQMVLD